jgi:hypothetical protein
MVSKLRELIQPMVKAVKSVQRFAHR